MFFHLQFNEKKKVNIYIKNCKCQTALIMMMITMVSPFHAYPIVHFCAHWNGVSQAYHQAVERVPKASYSKQEYTMGNEVLNVHSNSSSSQQTSDHFKLFILDHFHDSLLHFFFKKGSFVS